MPNKNTISLSPGDADNREVRVTPCLDGAIGLEQDSPQNDYTVAIIYLDAAQVIALHKLLAHFV